MAESDHSSTPGKSPAFQFYPKDFLADENVRAMSLQERGAYITLLCICWTEGSLPGDVTRLARVCGVPAGQMRKMWPALTTCFKAHPTIDGRLVNPRLERERKSQDEFRRRQSDASRKRWDSRGNPRLAIPVESQPGIPPESSSSAICDLRSSSADCSQSTPPTRVEEPTTLHQRAGAFVQWYEDTHQRLFRVGYMGTQRDWPTALKLAETFSDEDLRDAALVWFGQDDAFATDGTRTIAKFASRATGCLQKVKAAGLA